MIAQETVTDLHRRAALLPYFETAWIAPGDGELDPAAMSELEDFLLYSCERVVGPDELRYWTLTDAARSSVVAKVALDDLLAEAARLDETAPTDGAELLARYRHHPFPPAELSELSDGELKALIEVVRWLPPSAELPPVADLERLINLRAHVAPLAGLLADGFFGRATARAEIEAFLIDDGGRPLILHGPGGSGKSTLVARMALDDALRPVRPFVYLTFDLGQFRSADPRMILDEMIRQLELYPGWGEVTARPATTGPADIEVVRQRIRTAPLGGHDVSSRTAESAIEFAPADWEFLRQRYGHSEILLVLDTFEEVQRHDRSHRDHLCGFLDRLRQTLPGLRTIVAGRATVPEADAPEIAVGDLDPVDARAYLLHRLGVDPDEEPGVRGFQLDRSQVPGADPGAVRRLDADVVDAVLDVVPLSPLSLRLAADLLLRADPETDPYSLIAGLDEQVDGVLYNRILRHIRDPDVHNLAHPGLVLRRITPQLILEVLAKPCHLDVASLAEARELFDRLQAEATLVRRLPGTEVLLHREDVRRLMLPMVTRDRPDQVRAIHRRAIAFYKSDRSMEGRVEHLYHRLMAGQTRRTLDKYWDGADREVHLELVRAMDDYPTSAKVYLAERVDDIDLDQATRDETTDAQWAAAVEPRVVRRLSRGQLGDALDLLDERRGPGGEALLPRLEVEALERSGQLDAALTLAARARRRALVGGEVAMADGLTLDVARIHERSGRRASARREVERLVPAALTLAATVEADRRSDDDAAIEALIVLTTWLRLAVQPTASPDPDDPDELDDDRRRAVKEAALVLALSVPRRALTDRPSLYRDVVAEIGDLSGDLLLDAVEELGVVADDVGDQRELTSILEEWDTEVSAAEGSRRKLIEASITGREGADSLAEWVVQSDRKTVGVNVSKMLRHFGQSEQMADFVQRSFRKQSREALDLDPDLVADPQSTTESDQNH